MTHDAQSRERLRQAEISFNIQGKVDQFNRENPGEAPGRFESFEEPEIRYADWKKRGFIGLIWLMIVGLLGFITTVSFSGLMSPFAWLCFAVTIVLAAIILKIMNGPEHVVMRLHRELPEPSADEI